MPAHISIYFLLFQSHFHHRTSKLSTLLYIHHYVILMVSAFSEVLVKRKGWKTKKPYFAIELRTELHWQSKISNDFLVLSQPQFLQPAKWTCVRTTVTVLPSMVSNSAHVKMAIMEHTARTVMKIACTLSCMIIAS